MRELCFLAFMLIFFLFGQLVQGLETRKLEGLGNSENSWKIRAGGEYMGAAPKVSWLQTSHRLTAKSK